MRQMIIDGVDFYGLEIQKYWQPPASWSAEKKKKLHVLAEKHPFLLPALLVIAIVTALLSIANNLGLFE